MPALTQSGGYDAVKKYKYVDISLWLTSAHVPHAALQTRADLEEFVRMFKSQRKVELNSVVRERAHGDPITSLSM
jgi:hypothetical protein